MLDQPVARDLDIRLVRHESGDWLSPHTDREDKLFSHIIYFSTRWDAEWGGCLEILRSSDPADAVARVVPRLGASALLARSDESWHQVSPVTPVPGIPPRASLLVHGLR
ncbi:2OG-Fe(II) oxygenase family protein [Streptomyces anulatus]|uniref:2OG-Fe(II) oxygenase family protein n=1 Tax=Streptomyces anulatus TaxID=1892 RepID=UPI0033FAE0D0